MAFKVENEIAVVEIKMLPRPVLDFLRQASLNNKQWRRLFPIFAAPTQSDASSPKLAMLGGYTITDAGIRFEPRFPFEAGMAYTATFDAAELNKLAGRDMATRLSVAPLSFEMPAESHLPTTKVVMVYPSSDILPANLLKFYIVFSASMGEDNPHEFIHLFHGKEKVKLPFVEVKSGLWDADGRRLTLFFHPGRIKREVGPNLALGPPLEQGNTYRLVINRDMRDRSGAPLAQSFEKEFRVVEADRVSPDVAAWRIVSPAAASRDPLRIEFDEPLDRALALRFLTILNSKNDLVDGEVNLLQGETVWQLWPREPWRPGEYVLHVNASIEDLAGNRMNELFEMSLTRTKRSLSRRPFLTRTFRIEPIGKRS